MVPGGGAGSPCAGSVAATHSPPAVVTPSPTDPLQLTLFSRQGCCLCEGLEQRLRALELIKLQPPLDLLVVDIDAPGVEPALRARFDLEVPVLLLKGRILPRVSPRLSGQGLFTWLQRVCATTAGSD